MAMIHGLPESPRKLSLRNDTGTRVWDTSNELSPFGSDGSRTSISLIATLATVCAVEACGVSVANVISAAE
jgi:hypothetical protein